MMRTSLSLILKRPKITGTTRPIVRKIFTGEPTKKVSTCAVTALTVTLAATTAIASNTYDAKNKEQIKKQAHSIFRDHIAGLSSPELLEAAKILELYECYSDGNETFFRGEKLRQNMIDEMEKNLNKVLELKRNTSITTSHIVAENFSQTPFLENIMDIFLINVMGVQEHTKRLPILYDIKIPKDFKFIKIPNNYYVDFSDDSGHCLSECEYVIPMGTLIKITKSNAKESDSKNNHYTIHILENGFSLQN